MAVMQSQEAWEELLHVHGQEGQPWEDTPRPVESVGDIRKN